MPSSWELWPSGTQPMRSSRRWPARWRSCVRPAWGTSLRAPMQRERIWPGLCRIASRAVHPPPASACRRAPCWGRRSNPMCWWERVVALTTRLPESLRALVHVVLPIGSFAETSGTYVNAEGRWQSWAGASQLLGARRAGWEGLRVLANLLNVHGVDYVSSEEIREALKSLCGTRIEAGTDGVGSAAIGSFSRAA